MDLYIILGIERGASPGDIKRAYKRLARKYHPDINPGDQMAAAQFRQISNAYETLYLGGGADVKVVGNDFRQMDLKATQGAGETRIAAAARWRSVSTSQTPTPCRAGARISSTTCETVVGVSP